MYQILYINVNMIHFMYRILNYFHTQFVLVGEVILH